VWCDGEEVDIEGWRCCPLAAIFEIFDDVAAGEFIINFILHTTINHTNTIIFRCTGQVLLMAISYNNNDISILIQYLIILF
jgi:hypothetical protein